MTFSASQVQRSLLKKGFIAEDKHHHYYGYYHHGKMVARTKMSHNGQDINDYLISKMRKQCQLSKNEFLNLIKCPLDEKGYLAILTRQGII